MSGLLPLVSIIIPVYNAGKTVVTAIEGIQTQTYTMLELLFINDGSSDESHQIIEKSRASLESLGMRVNVVSHNQNQGVAAARNTGLDHATGEYIYYVDADDAIEPDAIETLVRAAEKHQADIVGCNWFLTFAQRERKMNQPAFTTPWDAIRQILEGTMRWNLWLFLVKRSLYEAHSIRFLPDRNMGEDLLVMMQLFIVASRVAYVDRALYHYGQSNEESLTKVYSDRHIDEVTENVLAAERVLRRSPYVEKLGHRIDYLKLNIKLPLLITDRYEQHRRWLRWFPEANNRVMENKALPFRTRFLQWLAVRKQFWAVRLYYRAVIRFVYGKLYK